ncbi:tRNA uracil 4-sulfurtransferase ThiI [Bulleidia sp. zg-1006]|uniref:tRNA uracil 4-sulfurtransferase ThiI n=1 Tax=Bulleidia sp. zg-1006 TaxID=2806552 RepID=UPI00193A76DC|nr:tRNA uracil 4-sulfurtransferase ThiI [Bulleidia sp. zg-1006]QRG87284.1 tRNA 4-thiouridine(8) synthase ThiI [Bulleidia sp. zg-1006]
MVHYDTVLIRFGELTTKGKNRKDFINRLYQNILYVLRKVPQLDYRKTYDRIYITLNGADHEYVKAQLKKVFGISSFSFTEAIPSTMEDITSTCLRLAKESDKKSFKMMTKRHDKNFPEHSDTINRKVATKILEETDLKVDVHHPELAIQVEIHEGKTYITYDKIAGIGGYPAGINGKVMMMLSGGIDSPVAAYQLIKRGLKIEAVHFASPPYTSEAAKNKVLKLASMVSEYQGGMKVHVVPFTDLQLDIYKTAKDPYAITLMRRMMFRMAERLAKENNCLAIGTGESLGQVASQTLESMATINDVVHMPVLRPLVSMDKVEIIKLARELGTYETSILPYEDCCTIFNPKNPVTKPTIKKSVFFENKFPWQELLEEAMQKTSGSIVYPDEEKEDFL